MDPGGGFSGNITGLPGSTLCVEPTAKAFGAASTMHCRGPRSSGCYRHCLCSGWKKRRGQQFSVSFGEGGLRQPRHRERCLSPPGTRRWRGVGTQPGKHWERRTSNGNFFSSMWSCPSQTGNSTHHPYTPEGTGSADVGSHGRLSATAWKSHPFHHPEVRSWLVPPDLPRDLFPVIVRGGRNVPGSA